MMCEQQSTTNDVLLQKHISFTSMLLSNRIKKGLAENGFKKPSPIQFKSIPLGVCGFDLIVKSKSGTGKTLVFTIVGLQSIDVSKKYLQMLVLVPTREIAVQIQDVIQNVGRYMGGLSVVNFIGGMPIDEDIIKAKDCQVAVGAPGRIKHLIKLDALRTSCLRLFVLDEADKLMDSVFQADINYIYDSLPQKKQLIATSATYPKSLQQFLANYMKSPIQVTSENGTPFLLGLKQFVIVLKSDNINAIQEMKTKNEMLIEILSKVAFTQCLIFTNYQSRAESVSNFLNQNGFSSLFISAAVNQNDRLRIFHYLRSFKNRILLTTDLTSRGIDVANVNLVINYDLPHDSVIYLHRMGRAGRYGSYGLCINFAFEGSDLKKLQIILGAIGVSNLSLPKLSSLDGVNLWNADPNNFEQIMFESNVKYENMLKEELENEIKLQSVSIHKLKKNSQSRETITHNLEKIIETSEDTKTDGLLNMLLIGETSNNTFDDCKKRKRTQNAKNSFQNNLKETNVTTPEKDCLQNRSDLESSSFSSRSFEDDSKKRKLSGSLCEYYYQRSFYKNRALLLITKMLSNAKFVNNEEFLEFIQEYLYMCKKRNHILPAESRHNKLIETNVKYEFINVLDNIFNIGYSCCVKNHEKTWMKCIPLCEVKLYQDFCEKECVVIENEKKCEDDLDSEMPHFLDSKEKKNRNKTNVSSEQDKSSQWIPIISSNFVGDHFDHFSSYFNDCSDVLWNTGLKFESVAEFDNWFYQWQKQLLSIRSYVQQNLYILEMNSYQQSRSSCN